MKVFITTKLKYSMLTKDKLIYWSMLQVLLIRLNQGQMKTKIKKKENDTFDSARSLYERRELVLTDFKSRSSPLKLTKGTGLKMLISKQMLPRLLIALAQVKVGNNSESLLNEIR